MPLPWVRLDSQWASNPKFLMLIEDRKWRSICVYMAGLGYCGAHGTGGFIPAVALQALSATRKEATELTEVQLWLPAPGGWEVNDWDEFQPSENTAQQRRERAQKAAQARWAKQEKSGAGNR